MSAVVLEYKIDDKLVLNAMKNLEHFNAFDMFDEIGSYLDSSVLKRFDDQVNPDGIPWKPSQRAEDEGGKTLIDFGHLRDSITHNSYNTAVEHGSNMIYAAIHQFGGKAGRNHATTIIQRAFVGISLEDEEEIDAIAKDFLNEALHG